MIPGNLRPLYCVLVLAAAVIVRIARCSCSEFEDI